VTEAADLDPRTSRSSTWQVARARVAATEGAAVRDETGRHMRPLPSRCPRSGCPRCAWRSRWRPQAAPSPWRPPPLSARRPGPDPADCGAARLGRSGHGVPRAPDAPCAPPSGLILPLGRPARQASLVSAGGSGVISWADGCSPPGGRRDEVPAELRKVMRPDLASRSSTSTGPTRDADLGRVPQIFCGRIGAQTTTGALSSSR